MRHVVVLLLAAALAPATATAAPRPKTLGSGPAIQTDGVRFALVPPGDRRSNHIRVFDDLRGTSYVWHEPKGDDYSAPGSGLIAVHSFVDGQVRVFDLAQRQWRTTARTDFGTDYSASDFSPQLVGRDWVVGTMSGNHYRVRMAWNWHSGEVRTDDPAGSGHDYLDLDSAELTHALCSPLRQPANPDDDPQGLETLPHYDLLPFEDPWGLSTDGGRVALERCGGQVKVLDAHPGSSFQLGGGIVSWVTDKGVVKAYSIADGRRFTWRRGDVSVAHTRTRIYVSLSNGKQRWVVWQRPEDSNQRPTT